MCRNLNDICLITTKFCTCTNSHAVGACADFCGDLKFIFEVIENIFSSSLGRNFASISGMRLRLSESESESEIVYSIDIHRIHLQIKLHNTITHTHVNRW